MMQLTYIVGRQAALRKSAARATSRRGVAVVELAILAPFLVFLFAVAIDFCRVFYYSQTLYNCAYSGALYGSATASRNTTTTSAEAAAKAAAVAEGTTLSPALTSSQVTYTPPDAQNEITVTVTYTFSTFTGGVPGIPSSVTLTRWVKMRVSPKVTTP